MRIVILGGSGMLGHVLWKSLPWRFPDTFTTLHKGRKDYGRNRLFQGDRVIDHIDASDFKLLTGVLKGLRPDIVLNCIGVTKRKEDPQNPIPSILINALLPHRLAEWTRDRGARLIHFSTDCVFDGKDGNYGDESPPNATNLYGRTKALGEVRGKHILTLRSSFIGKELGEGTELLEWFLSQRTAIIGFKKAIYSGLTTLELSRLIERLLAEFPHASGLYNVSSEPINKYDLLKLIGEKMHPKVTVDPDETFQCDRSLDSTKFRNAFNYTPPAWTTMLEELSRKVKEEL